MVGDLFINLAFEDFRKAGQDGYRYLKRRMTAATFLSLGISDHTKERLNRLVIGVATMVADNFRNGGFRFCSPADL